MDNHNRLIITKVTPAYWRVVLNNPPFNLFDELMFADFMRLMDDLDRDPDVKIIVLDSENPDYFCGLYEATWDGRSTRPETFDFNEWPRFVTRLANSRVVSVCKLRGRARGQGSEITLACDIRFASKEKAHLTQPEVSFSVVPGGGGSNWLPRLVGRSRALEIILGADDIDADTAEKYGYVNRSIPDAELDAFVDNFVRRVSNFDKRALELAKKSVNAHGDGMAPEAERWASAQSFLGTLTWPDTQAKLGKVGGAGLLQDPDFYLNMPARMGAFTG
jgi:enoyl-CoA hydratase/carnithine racemase